jgi:hypothetical protein
MSNESKLITHLSIIDFLRKKLTKCILVNFSHGIMDILDTLLKLLSSYTNDRLILNYLLRRKDSELLHRKSFDEYIIFHVRTRTFMGIVTVPAIYLLAYSILLQAGANINLASALSASTSIICLVIIEIKDIPRF